MWEKRSEETGQVYYPPNAFANTFKDFGIWDLRSPPEPQVLSRVDLFISWELGSTILGP